MIIYYTITDCFGKIIESFLFIEERDAVYDEMREAGLQVGWGSVFEE